jgi:hypothetical protein
LSVERPSFPRQEPRKFSVSHRGRFLLKIYAHFIDGQADAANQRIADALGTTEPEPGPGDEGDADSEPAA